MGANQYTPTTDEVRAHWENVGFAGTGDEFDRWLEQVRAEAKAEALLEAADGLQQDSEAYFKTATTLLGDDNTRYHAYASMLKSAANRTRKRANQYKEGK